MRLTKIKLAGFKSFVDPTIFHLPSNLVGIVGPNGCGKSNIIDAVRWVMGESAVRHLRGESMADVIFSGSATRKPVGQASIELIFDNSVARLGGPWAHYNEIAVRRLLTRGGGSSYFLNGTRCRRRDITDLFLGTGLGPRSYAIIEQGMITRLIEAKPEDLRVFFEEAAGISKYKERRRETETRIRHTRENLERVNDLAQELEKQLNHLQRQARNAERYKDYKVEERRLKAELLALHWRSLQTEVSSREREIQSLQTTLEGILAEQRHLESQLETGRTQQHSRREQLDQVQERYYQVGSEINRLEQELAHRQQLWQRQQDERERLIQSLQQTLEQIRLDSERLQQLQQNLTTAEPALASARTLEQESSQALEVAQLGMEVWQTHWEAYNQQVGETRRQAEVERTRMEQLERQLKQQRRRAELLVIEQQGLDPTQAEQELVALGHEEQALTLLLSQQQEALEQADDDMTQLGEAQQELTTEIHCLQGKIQTKGGRLSSLKTLQQAARHQSGSEKWLQNQGLDSALRLAEDLRVEPGWERAVEIVLDAWLEAVCVVDLESQTTALAGLSQGSLNLLERPSQALKQRAGWLSEKVQSVWMLDDLLAGVYTVENLDQALTRRRQLKTGESLITPEGVWLGRHWLRLLRDKSSMSGVLIREREIRSLEIELAQDAQILEEYSQNLESQSQVLKMREGQRRSLQETYHQNHRQQAQLQGQENGLSHRWRQIKVRCASIIRERQELEHQIEGNDAELEQAKASLQQAQETLQRTAGEKQILEQQRQVLRTSLEQTRQQAAQSAAVVQHQILEMESLRNGCDATEQALQRLEAQRNQLSVSSEQLSQDLSTDEDASIREQLEVQLEAQMSVEEELKQARQSLEQQQAELHELEQQRSRCETRQQKQRQDLEARRLSCNEVRVHQQTRQEQLRELEAEPASVLAELPADASEAQWQAQLEQLAKRIQRLGAINLAAIEEFAQLSERKHYLDTQQADLMEALSTLENAMAKIDRETRSRFKETFNKIDAGLQTLFPRLFGGGQAHLELAGEDTLNAGVAVMVQPPGKRIGSIHLLSGGEKALTAVALVFAIFQLNPAPFCLLDEVDAPLDDANVGRFGALVREMSEQVQFIFITHNKGTMEIAQHLSGVTMHEPGVSRLVSVDVEEAARLVAV